MDAAYFHKNDGLDMALTREVEEIFEDAFSMQQRALNLIDSDIRDAAEKSWCATKTATDGLIKAWTGERPEKAPVTSRMFRQLAVEDRGLSRLVDRYSATRDELHGDCFYMGLLEPADSIRQLIRETDGYIRDIKRLADRGR